MASLGSSPLGLIIDSSNSTTNTIGTYERGQILGDGNLYKSIFQNNAFTPSSNYGQEDIGRDNGDDSYDISVGSILDYTANYPSMRLLASDFAYLKDLGVYPNNRLIVARRFAAGVPNDLTTITSTPLSTIVSWIPEGEDFIEMSYGEHWIEATASFKDILNEVGKDLTTPGIGNIASSGGGVIPLPGFMEGLQYDIMKRMGIVDDAKQIPAGNPNIIREAMMRRTFKDGEAGSGLKCAFDIKMEVVYEQKFINNVDPTLVYFDIVANLLSFGTSDAYFQYNGSFNSGVSTIISDLISGDVARITRAIASFVEKFVEAIKSFVGDLVKSIKNTVSNAVDTGDISGAAKKFADQITVSLISPIIKKYKIRLIGVANALTGTTSTPWHVTIGNPKRPTFSSGDLFIDDIRIKMGDNLSYNDLPKNITAIITFKNARSLGGDEIFQRFNNGVGRSSKRLNLSLVEYTHNDDGSGKNQPEYTQTERNNPNKMTPRAQIEPVNSLTPIGVNSDGVPKPVSSGILTGANVVTPINTEESRIPPPVPQPIKPSKFKWNVLVDKLNGATVQYSGESVTSAMAQETIDKYVLGGKKIDQSIQEVDI